MVDYFQQEVKRACNNPSAGATAILLVGITGSPQQVRERVESIGGDIIEELPFDTLRIELPEKRIAELCDVAGITSIEFGPQ